MSLSISNSSRVKRRVDHNQPLEVVDDSEPEREEARKCRKEERRRRKEEVKSSNTQLIELTDSDSLDITCVRSMGVTNCAHDHAVNPPPVDILVKELSTGHDRNRLSVSKRKTMRASTKMEAEHPPKRDADNTEDQLPIPDSQSLTITDDGPTSDEIDEKPVSMSTKLGSFAFSACSRASSTVGNSSKPTKQVMDTTRMPKFKPARNPGSAEVYLNFSARQLESLLKCVSCDLKWTTRKSSGSKATHMRACAKKARLAEETMATLITREISTASRLYTKTQPNKVSGGECAPKTFLEDLVKDVDCPRPGKRQKEVLSSVKPVVESRDDILQRAKAILHEPYFGQSTKKNKLDDEAAQPPPTTQTFEKSRLTTSMDVPSYSSMDGEPLLTQALPGSGLGSAFSVSRATLHPFGEMTEGPPAAVNRTKVTTPIRSRSSLLSPEMNGDVVSSRYSPSLRTSHGPPDDGNLACDPDDVFLYVSEYDGEGSDAILVFDPAMREDACDPESDEEPANNDTILDNATFSRTPTAQRPHSDIFGRIGFYPHPTRGNNPGLRLTAEMNHVYTADRTFVGRSTTERTVKMISPRKRYLKQGKEQSADKEVDDPTISDEDLFEKFKAMVLEDEALYRRILRYEPIRFELFLDMAQGRVKEYNLGPLLLKLKLKVFLDQQAIHYCEGSWNRR